MAFILTYTSAVEQLVNYFQRNDDEFMDAIPSFFTFGINKISADLKNLGLGLYANFSYTINSPILQKPADWRSTISLTTIDADGNITVLQKREYEYARLFWPNETATGLPIYYADYDFNNYLVVPTPDATYQAQLSYFATMQLLDEENQTNWATEYAPQLLFKALQREAAIYLRQDERVTLFDAEYASALTAIQSENSVRKFDRTSQGELA